MGKDQELFDALREFRNKVARKENKELFMVFQNETLKAIARSRPQNNEELLSIKGIGEKKIEKYGQFILDLVKNRDSQAKEIKSRVSEEVFTVSEFIDSVNEIFAFKKTTIQGEVGKVDTRDSYSFFTLRDKEEKAMLNCFVWQNKLEEIGLELKEGLELKVTGLPEVYKPRGSFTFRVTYLELVGEGALKQAFDALKKKLGDLGFFDLTKKKPIPQFAEKIGLITSQFADAKKDFLKHLGRRGFSIQFYDVRVEGAYSIDEIVSAIRWFNENSLDLDVLVITRGGGSWESLQSFNSEAVAKAVFGSKIPIICGVGHEADETIADYVADKRASTPTDAAKILSQPWEAVASQINFFIRNIFLTFEGLHRHSQDKIIFLQQSLIDRFGDIIRIRRDSISEFANNLNYSFQSFFRGFDKLKYSFLNNFQIFQSLLRRTNIRIVDNYNLLNKVAFYWLKIIDGALEKEKEKLKLASPEIRLKQGYSIVIDKLSKRVIREAKQLKVGDKLRIKFHRGNVDSRVEEIYE